jgi:hypothetical protein
MQRISDISRTGNKSTQVDTTPREKNPVSIVSLLALGASFFVLVAMTLALYQEFTATGKYGLVAYLLGMIATAVFLWLSALLALRFRTKKAKPAPHKVRAALISALRTDKDPNVRYAAAKGLAELDLEESTEHIKHDDLDSILISTLQTDSNSQVRSAAAEGLAVVELEQHSYHHQHDRVDDTLLKHGIP